MSTTSNAMTAQPAANRKSNRLMGWLVSYGIDAKGAAFEIRAGRSMITSEASKDGHVISIREESVSAPHAALNAINRDKVVLLQDIFSDYGTFITRSGEREEFPVEGPIELEHGDWIRIGETVRFQVCLIDGGK